MLRAAIRHASRQTRTVHPRLPLVANTGRTLSMATQAAIPGTRYDSQTPVNTSLASSSATRMGSQLETTPAAPTLPTLQPDRRHDSPDPKTPTVFSFFEPATSTWQYVVADIAASRAVIIDPVLDYDPASGAVSTKSADGLLGFVKDRGLTVTHILCATCSLHPPCNATEPGLTTDLYRETHAHADHLTSSQYLKLRLGNVPVCIGERITQVQETFAPVYGFDEAELFENTFDIYFKDDAEFTLGSTTCRVLHLPGHTPDHVGYVFGLVIFTGDSIFNVSRSPCLIYVPRFDSHSELTARRRLSSCGLPGRKRHRSVRRECPTPKIPAPRPNPNAHSQSMQRLLSYPQDALLFVGHDYPPADTRVPEPSATVGAHQDAWRTQNESSFVAWRERRDATLGAPRLLHPALQVNIRAGKLPPKDAKGRTWFRTPVRGVQW